MNAARLSDRVRLVRANNPSPLTLEGTNTYVVGDGAPVVIDPGPNDLAHLETVLEEAGQPSLVLLTHRHPDHAEGAERFAAMAGAPLAAFGSTFSTCEDVSAIIDGQQIEAGGVTLVAAHTPGHASDHLCFWLEQERALFTGDHVLGRGTTVIAYPDGDMAAYMGSLERTEQQRPARLYPGHGPVIEEPEPVLAYYRQHRLDREQEVLAAIDAGDATVGDMVRRIYAAYDASLHGAAALSVRAHLRKLEQEGALRSEGDRWTRSG